MIFTPDQARAYFEWRNPGEKFPQRGAVMLRCPFHGDRTASMSVNLDRGGIWNCHGCNKGGGIYAFEKEMFPSKSDDEVWAEIYKRTGAAPDPARAGKFVQRGPVVATYDYLDPGGKLLFQKQRHDPKFFTQRAPRGDGWVYTLEGVRKVLYKLPDLMTAQVAFITEGEKDADALWALEMSHAGRRIAATCNFDGAGKWKEEYSPFFAGRRVVIFPDNDDPGRAHAQAVAASVFKYAESVKVVALSGLPEKGDVSDYLAMHTKDELLEEVRKATTYQPADATAGSTPFFVSPSQICPDGGAGFDWLVPGVIHRGGKGIFIAAPKAGKSMIALDLSIALAHGLPWLGIPITKTARVALVSREDGPGMTMNRLKAFALGRNLDFNSVDVLVNTYQQRSSFTIDDDAHVTDLCKWLKHEKAELCIFDVLNKLHGAADENNAMEMTRVMGRFDSIRHETGCDIVVIHHDAKNGNTGKPRGSSAIDSWWDWKVSITVDPEDDRRKQIFFATKAGQAAPPVVVEFQQSQFLDAMRILPHAGGAA